MNRLSKNEEKLKQKLNSQQFEYDPAHWKAAAEVLATQEAGTTGTKFKAIWLTLPVLVVVAGIIRWSAPEATSLAESKIVRTVPLVLEKENIDDKSITPLLSTHPDNLALPQADSKEIISNSLNEELNSNPLQTAAVEKTEVPVSANTSAKKEKSNAADIKKTNRNPNNSIQDNKTELNSNKATPLGNTIVLIPEENNKDKSETPTAKETAITNTTAENKEEASNKDNDVVATKPKIADAGEVKEEKKKEEDQKDSKPPKQILIKNSLSAIVGANYSKLITPSGNGYINTPYFGLQYQYQLNPKWQFNTGLGYSYVKANGLEKEYITEQYSFGLTTENTTINTERLHYIELPILARYRAFNNFSFIGGTNITYLLNTNSTVNKSAFNTLGGKQALTQTNENQYKKGVSHWDVQMQFGLEYKLNNNLHLGLLANTGLLDVSKNNYYNTVVFNRNSRLQLYIKYDFIRF